MELALEQPRTITCSMCGTSFDPTGHQACRSCPLQKGCQVVCCPSCGFETVDVGQSRLAQAFSSLLGWIHPAQPKLAATRVSVLSLADLPPGKEGRVLSFSAGLPAGRQAHLQAYGVIPGNAVRVTQQAPVTVVQVEYTEIALENGLAGQIQVEMLS